MCGQKTLLHGKVLVIGVTTLNQIMEPVEAMVYVLNKVGLIIFVILLVITAVGITNTFRMILVERTKEIGTMRAFGMQQETVKYIFLMEALLLSLAGGVAGVGVTAIVAFVLGKIEFTTLPAMQFFLNQGHITFSISLGSVVLNLVIVLVMSLIAAYWPARAAAKLFTYQGTKFPRVRKGLFGETVALFRCWFITCFGVQHHCFG